MSTKNSIGIGGVMAEIVWISGKEGPSVPKNVLVDSLCNRFGFCIDNKDDIKIVEIAIDIAERCGVIEYIDNGFKVKYRPKSCIKL